MDRSQILTVLSSEAETIWASCGEKWVTWTGLASEYIFIFRGAMARKREHSLGMLLHCSQDCSTADIENLHDTLVATSHDELSVLPELSSSGGIFEPGDRLDDLAGFGGIDQYPCGRGDGISVRAGGREVDVSDRSWVFDEQRVSERVEVSRVRSDRR